MNDGSSDNRSPMAIGLEWSTRMMVIGLEMAIPAACGYWLDSRAGTMPIFVCVGALFGFFAGMFHLLQIAHRGSENRK
jgi:F0F1-type ATP synthase assembly protein I